VRLKAKGVEIYCAALGSLVITATVMNLKATSATHISFQASGEYSPKWASIQLVNLLLILLRGNRDFLTIGAIEKGNSSS
jgi:hypothetical protein